MRLKVNLLIINHILLSLSRAEVSYVEWYHRACLPWTYR